MDGSITSPRHDVTVTVSESAEAREINCAEESPGNRLTTNNAIVTSPNDSQLNPAGSSASTVPRRGMEAPEGHHFLQEASKTQHKVSPISRFARKVSSFDRI